MNNSFLSTFALRVFSIQTYDDLSAAKLTIGETSEELFWINSLLVTENQS